jgi:hypothetical protein
MTNGEHGGPRRKDGGERDEQEEQREQEQDGERRVVDDDTPTSDGLTSPGEGLDDAPAEPRQAQDYP